MALSAEILFNRHPELEAYLSSKFEDKLVSEVSPSVDGAIHTVMMSTLQMARSAANHRAVHSTHAQQYILQCLQPSKTEPLDINVPPSLFRDERGLNHHVTARFLIPRQHLDEYERDPEGYATSQHLTCLSALMRPL
jgi:hypothetical protein